MASSYSQWEEIYWQSSNRFYHAVIQQDLFANWIITRRWGGRHNNINGQKHDCFSSYNEAQKKLKIIAKERIKRGYTLCSN